jgi:hypothetical protein
MTTAKVKLEPKLYVKVTFFQILQSPIHVVDKFEINRTTNFIQPLEEFLSINNLIEQAIVGDRIVIEILALTKKEFENFPLANLKINGIDCVEVTR